MNVMKTTQKMWQDKPSMMITRS